MKTTKWIVFDVTGVIVPFTLKNSQGYTVATRHFFQNDLEGVFFTKDYKNYMLGTLSHEQFIGRYIQKNKLDLSIAEFDEIFKKDVTPTPGMKELIEKLSRKYKIALASNEGKMFAKYKIEGSGTLPYLSKIVVSYLVREIKPSINFYKKLLIKINAQPDECVFIDDTKENVDAANSLLMKGIVFKDVNQLEKDLHVLQLM